MLEGIGFWGLVVLALDIWAILSVAQSSASMMAKVIWIVVILALPLLGFIAWLIIGPKSSKS